MAEDESHQDETRSFVALTSGTTVGHYQIVSKIGSGGMGEVYLALDTKLNRKVALKFLPSHLCQDEECRRRFTREAHAAAGLDHPNIAGIYEVGDYQGRPFFAMQLVEGRSLREVIAGKDLSIDSILEIAIQACEGLQAAHDRGIIHRDIKPSNLLLDSHGRVRIVDFGLASVRDSEQLTKTGSTLGTVGYMSPEQVQSKDVDQRSDLFSLGVVLYEMITKQNPFKRDTEAATLRSVVDDLPEPLARYKSGLPDKLQMIIEKTLEKDVKVRYQHADDMQADLLRVKHSLESRNNVSYTFIRKRQTSSRLAWVIAVIFAVIAAALAWQRTATDRPKPQSFRFTIPKPEGVANVEWPLLSPDGRYLAFLGFDSLGNSQIWVRPLNSEESYPLEGTVVSSRKLTARPFWSPDSKYLAVYDVAEGRLKKMSADGGPPVTICKTTGCDGTWGSNDVILFDDFKGREGIAQVPASGGEPRIALAPNADSGEVYVSWPSFLPDGHHFIYVDRPDYFSPYTDDCALKVADLHSNETKVLGTVVGRAACYAPGYIMYLKNDLLIMHKFNTNTLELEGDPIPLTDMPSFRPLSWGLMMNASASQNGIVTWQKGAPLLSRMVWVDRDGNDLDTIGEPALYSELQLSPDNRYVSYYSRKFSIGDFKIGILELHRGNSFRLTSGDYQEFDPVWSSDGDAIAFTGRPDMGHSSLEYCRLNDPVSTIVAASDSSHLWAMLWSRANELWFCEYLEPAEQGKRILTLDISDPGNRQLHYLLPEEVNPRGVSPDGRYLLSEGSAIDWRTGIYVNDMTAPSRRWEVTAAGRQARWGPGGKEIFFFEGDNFMCVTVDTTNGFSLSTPTRLFSRPQFVDPSLTRWGYDVSSDGQRFLFITPVGTSTETTGDIEVIVNWQTEFGVGK